MSGFALSGVYNLVQVHQCFNILLGILECSELRVVELRTEIYTVFLVKIVDVIER